jgi:hypothetical protein
MSKRQFEELLKSLKNIEDKLETIITLQKTIVPKPSLGKEERKVLKLCDRKHTIDDIVKETEKTENNVGVILSHLRDKALIRSVEIKNRIVYEKI